MYRTFAKVPLKSRFTQLQDYFSALLVYLKWMEHTIAIVDQTVLAYPSSEY